jgi:Ubiquitin-activating enzyme E1 FCCH domain
MDEINNLEPAEIKMLSPHCFEVNIDVTEFSNYSCRGRGNHLTLIIHISLNLYTYYQFKLVEQIRNGVT